MTETHDSHLEIMGLPKIIRWSQPRACALTRRHSLSVSCSVECVVVFRYLDMLPALVQALPNSMETKDNLNYLFQ